MDPAQIKGIPCFALVMCTAHLLRPLYFKILDPPLGYSRHNSGTSRERVRITRRAQDGSVHMQCSLPSSSYRARSTLT